MDTSPNTKHTPGPWSYFIQYPYQKHPEWPYATISAGSAFALPPADGFKISGIITEADARLIAAAPDLLEACRGLVFAEQCSEKSLAAEIYKARRAIAKAEGK